MMTKKDRALFEKMVYKKIKFIKRMNKDAFKKKQECCAMRFLDGHKTFKTEDVLFILAVEFGRRIGEIK